MATHKGSEGIVKIGTNTVAEVTGFSFDETADTIEDTALSDSSRTYVSDLTSFSGSIDCMWDETDTTGQGAMTAGASVTLNLYPEGATTGDVYYTGTALITSISRANAIGAMVTASFSFQGTGALTSATA
tara:strand:- start:543 stop:932 length:390 start_codon:yes stop_codon:yes gene_type:complete